MRKLSVVPLAAMLSLGAFGSLSLGGTAAGASTGSGHPNKTAFCSANVAIDKATAKVTSEAGLLAVVKTHSADLKAMKKDAPAGAVGATVRKVVAAVDTAIASGNANDLNNVPNGAAVDTYCGVDKAFRCPSTLRPEKEPPSPRRSCRSSRRWEMPRRRPPQLLHSWPTRPRWRRRPRSSPGCPVR